MQLDIHLPLAITRNWLYLCVYFATAFFVLLPLSIITYLNFYRILIPVSSSTLHTKFTPFHNDYRSVSTPSDSLLRYFGLHSDLHYDINLHLKTICNTRTSEIAHVRYNAFTGNHNTDENNTPLAAEDVFIINCNLRTLYFEKNHFIPYNLRNYVPPFVVDITDTRTTIIPLRKGVSGQQISGLLQKPGAKQNVVVNVKSRSVYVDSDNSYFEFQVRWDGIRYYIYHYYFTSLVLGVGFFWAVSSLFCLISSLLVWSSVTSGTSDERKTQKKVQ